MIKLDQVQLLENRVEKAVTRIAELTSENSMLKRQNEELAKKNAELDELVSLFEEDQSRIEETIQRTLNRLNEVEDTVHQTAAMTVQSSQPSLSQHIPPQEVPQDHETSIEPSFIPDNETPQEQSPEQLDIF